MEKSKKAVSYLLAAAALTTVTTASVNQNVKAENDVKVATEPKQETDKVSAVVLENEQGAVIRVTAHEDVQKVKTTYTVDGTQAKTVSFGNLTKGQVKDIRVNFGTQKSAVKTVKTLPNTAVVSDRVEFAKTVKSHAIKGSVSFEYETAEVAPTTPVVTPTVPTKPTDSVKPVKPVDTTKPVTPTKPVDTVKPTEPTKPVDVTKPSEPVKPVDTPKPTDPAKPVEKPTTPVGTQPKDEPTTPKEDNGTWKEETRTRTVTVDEEYTENTTEDVYETKQLKERWIMVAKNDGTILANVGWESDVTQAEIGDALFKYNADKTIEEERVRETKKVKVGTKTVPVTKVRKVQKQETYTVWVNSKTGEVRTSEPTVPSTPKEDNGTWKEETRTRTVTVDEEYTENTTEDVFETKQLFDDWVYLIADGVRHELGWVDEGAYAKFEEFSINSSAKDIKEYMERKVRETKKVKVGTKTVPVTKVRKVQKQETYTVWVNSKTGEVRTERPIKD